MCQKSPASIKYLLVTRYIKELCTEQGHYVIADLLKAEDCPCTVAEAVSLVRRLYCTASTAKYELFHCEPPHPGWNWLLYAEPCSACPAG